VEIPATSTGAGFKDRGDCSFRDFQPAENFRGLRLGAEKKYFKPKDLPAAA